MAIYNKDDKFRVPSAKTGRKKEAGKGNTNGNIEFRRFVMGRRIATGIFFAALLALLAWAAITGMIGKYFERALGSLAADGSAVSEEDVLFDDDSTVDWSVPEEDVLGEDFLTEDPPAQESTAPKTYEFELTKDYFDVLLEKYASDIPIRGLSTTFSDGQVVFSGGADVSALSELLNIPSALTLFLPSTVDCKLYCVPVVKDGRIRVSVAKVTAGSDMLSPFLQREGILSSVENFLNDLLRKHLPDHYKMQSATVSQGKMYVRFCIESE